MKRVAYHPYGSTGPNRMNPPFWPIDDYIKPARQLKRPSPFKKLEESGATYLHSRRRLDACGNLKDRNLVDRAVSIDPDAQACKGYWYKLEDRLTEKLKVLDTVLVDLYNKLQGPDGSTTPFDEQAPRFIRQLWDHFLCTICPEGKTNRISKAPALEEEDIKDASMREALRHATDAESVLGWLRELGKEVSPIENSSSRSDSPAPPARSRNPAPVEDPPRALPVPGPSSRPFRASEACDAVATVDLVNDSESDDSITIVPGGEMLEKLLEISATYGTTGMCPQLIALSRAMEQDRLKGPGGSKAARVAYDALRGRRASLLVSLTGLAQKECPPQGVMKARQISKWARPDPDNGKIPSSIGN